MGALRQGELAKRTWSFLLVPTTQLSRYLLSRQEWGAQREEWRKAVCG